MFTRIRILARVGLVVSLLFLLGVLPFAVIKGEFANDLELAFPGLLFWLGIFTSRVTFCVSPTVTAVGLSVELEPFSWRRSAIWRERRGCWPAYRFRVDELI